MSTSADTAGHQQAEPLMTAGQLAKRFAVSQAWVYQAAKDGRLPHRRLGSADGPVRFFSSGRARSRAPNSIRDAS